MTTPQPQVKVRREKIAFANTIVETWATEVGR